MSSKSKTTIAKEDGNPPLLPKLRFPEFQEAKAWKSELLGNLCIIRTGKKDANEGAADGSYPFFTCAEKHIYSHSYSFDAEAILIAGNANVGQTNYYHGKFEAYQRTYVLTDFTRISVPYLYSILNARLRASLQEQVQVSAMSYIKLPMLQEYILSVPPSFLEQQKIADCLTSVDELIAAQARKVDALRAHKKGLMQELFPREGETQPRLRFPEFQDAGEWEKTPVENLIITVTPPRKIPTSDYQSEGEYPIIDQSQDYICGWTNDGKALINKGLPVIVFGDHTCVLKFISRPFAQGADGIKIIRPKGEIDTRFLFYVLEANSIVQDGYKRHFSALKEKFVIFPDSKSGEQHRIAEFLTSLDDLIAAETQKLEAIKSHKKGLMQQLFPSAEVEL